MELALVWLGFAVVTAVAASSKGRSTVGWFILGLFFSFFALLLVAILPSRKVDPFSPTPETHVRCPQCREFIFMDASICKHCGTKLVPQQPDPSGAQLLGRKIGAMFVKR